MVEGGHWPWLERPDAARSRGGLPAGEPLTCPWPCSAPSSPPSRRLAHTGAPEAPPRTAQERGALPGRPWYKRIDWWHVAPVAIAIAFAIVYLIWQPRTVDLAAHTFRADLFGQEGFTIWNGQWYGGHHTPAYSIISPPLAWLLSPPLALALSRR